MVRPVTELRAPALTYQAHARRPDGTELEVLADENLSVTAVNEMQHPKGAAHPPAEARPSAGLPAF
jgi:hypothetical protein